VEKFLATELYHFKQELRGVDLIRAGAAYSLPDNLAEKVRRASASMFDVVAGSQRT
jgi:hypothetical protein